MQKKRKSFVFYESFFELFSLVKKSARWPLFEALCMYAFEGVEIELPTQLQAIMSAIKPQIDACNRRYERAKKRAKDTASEDEITPVNEGTNDSQSACKNACKNDDTNTPLNVNANDKENGNENANAPSRPTPSRPTRGNTRGKNFSSNSSKARARVLDSRAAFDLFYAERRSRAEAVVARNRAKAEQVEGFKEAERALRVWYHSWAVRELRGEKVDPAEEEQLHANIRACLAQVGLTESDLEPHYTCPKCNDTGFLPDGHICDCYNSP